MFMRGCIDYQMKSFGDHLPCKNDTGKVDGKWVDFVVDVKSVVDRLVDIVVNLWLTFGRKLYLSCG